MRVSTVAAGTEVCRCSRWSPVIRWDLDATDCRDFLLEKAWMVVVGLDSIAADQFDSIATDLTGDCPASDNESEILCLPA